MDIPLKFIFGWLIIITVTYSCVGYIYNTSLEKPELDVGENAPDSWLDIVTDGINFFIGGFITLFKVFFFVLPDMPLEVTAVINLIVQPINIISFYLLLF